MQEGQNPFNFNRPGGIPGGIPGSARRVFVRMNGGRGFSAGGAGPAGVLQLIIALGVVAAFIVLLLALFLFTLPLIIIAAVVSTLYLSGRRALRRIAHRPHDRDPAANTHQRAHKPSRLADRDGRKGVRVIQRD
ncbi:MAG: hypothetical protein AAF842_12750 [Planctomycetota bacterium]